MAVAEGLTIITYKGNEEFFKDLIARPHTIVPDELAKTPQPLKLVTVDDQMTMKDASMEVQLYHLLDNPREGTNLFAYVPRDRILVQADLYDSTWQFHHWGENVITNIEKIRKLTRRQAGPHPRQHSELPGHGQDDPAPSCDRTPAGRRLSQPRAARLLRENTWIFAVVVINERTSAPA